MLIVGDIVGQGPEAATLSSLARYTLRAAAELTGDPARAIGHLNAVLREQPGVPLCTAVCARIEERRDGVARLRWPAPATRRRCSCAGQEVTAVGEPGTIAGRVRRRRVDGDATSSCAAATCSCSTRTACSTRSASDDRFGERAPARGARGARRAGRASAWPGYARGWRPSATASAATT